MNAATSDRQAGTVVVGTETIATIVQQNSGTAPAKVLRPAQAAKPTLGAEDILLQAGRVRPLTSTLSRRANVALVIALLAPPALIVLLMAFGLQFALAVCIMFVAVFVITTSRDAMWLWRRHGDAQRPRPRTRSISRRSRFVGRPAPRSRTAKGC